VIGEAVVSMLESGLERLDEGFGVFDAGHRLLASNRRFSVLGGYPPVLCRPGTPLAALLHHGAARGDFGDVEADVEVARRLGEIRTAETCEVEHNAADGCVLRIRYCALSGGGLAVTYQDISEAVAARAALAARERRHALISEATSEGHYDWDIVADVLVVSARLNRIFGFAAGDLNSRTWYARVHPEDQAGYRAALGDHFRGTTPRLVCEYRIRDRAGDYVWVQDSAVAERGATGRAERLVGAITDVSARVRADAALRDSEERYALVSQATSEGHYDWNVVRDQLDVSERLNRIFDFDVGELTSEAWYERVHPEDAAGYRAALRGYFRGETPRYSCEYRIRDKHGAYRAVRDDAIGVRDGRGRVVRLVGAVADLTAERAAAAELDRVRARLSGSLDAIAEGYLLTDAEDRVVLWNRRYVEIFSGAAGGDISDLMVAGRPYREILEAGYRRGIFPPHPGGLEGWLAERASVRVEHSGELELCLSDGSWVQVHDRRMPDGGRVALFSDVTDRRRREAEVEDARDRALDAQGRFEDAIESLSSGFALFDAEDRLVVCNTRYREYFSGVADLVVPGRTLEEFIRAGVARGLFPLAADDPQTWIQGVLKRRRRPGGTREQVMAGGLYLQVSDHRTRDGGLVSIYTDVSAIRESEERLRRILENSPIGVAILDHANVIRYHNPRFADILRAPGEDLTGTGSERFWTDVDRRTATYRDFEVAGLIRDRENCYRGVDGSLVWSLTTYVRTEFEGAPARLTWIYDVTEARANREALERAKNEAEAALAELRRAQDRLVEAQKLASLGQLTGGIAHEIKNPLNFVNNFAKLSAVLLGELRDVIAAPIAALDEEARADAEDLLGTVVGNLTKIAEHGARADAIVRNMLAHSREGPGEARRFRFNETVSESLNLAYHGARAEDQSFNVTLEEDFDPGAGEVEGFAQELSRVFLNLFGNGFYAVTQRARGGEPGYEPRVTVSTRSLGEAVEATVWDNGTGIPPGVRDRIFTPFFTTKPTGEGTGLGLSLSYDIVVKQHGGTMEVESVEGDHTTFRITVPRGGEGNA
jgi:PAS domain S-box-containing protein